MNRCAEAPEESVFRVNQLRVRVGRDVLLQGWSVSGVLVVHYLIWLLLLIALLILIAFLA
jgi:hypothetical protein